jgi:hypothetical protein
MTSSTTTWWRSTARWQQRRQLTIYRTKDNYKVDSLTYAALPADQRGLTTTAFDEEFAANEAKRNIKVIPQDFVGSLVAELKRLF